MDIEEKTLSAVDFFKIRHRMCKTYHNCEECPSHYGDGGCLLYEDSYLSEQPQEAVKKVEDWAKKHPPKNRKNELLKIFPNVDKNSLKVLCPQVLDTNWECPKMDCEKCRFMFWTEAIE